MPAIAACSGGKRVSRSPEAVPTPSGMATLGTPPAGWYTDPSGQHRARYWDGASWTEQVRDDVAAPSAVSGGEQTHEVAATVANIAQALATVAEQDVAEPAFVVDYGTEEPVPYTRPQPTRVTPASVAEPTQAMAQPEWDDEDEEEGPPRRPWWRPGG